MVSPGCQILWSSQLTCGVAQGSVLGPMLFSAYTRPREQITKRRNRSLRFYVDIAKLYFSFNQAEVRAALTRLKNYLSDIRD